MKINKYLPLIFVNGDATELRKGRFMSAAEVVVTFYTESNKNNFFFHLMYININNTKTGTVFV